MVDPALVLQYYGNPPYYRNKVSGFIEPLPLRVRLPDGSTRTDPSQWASDPEILELAGYELSDITQNDIDIKKPNLEDLRKQKLDILDEAWKNAIKDGWVTPYGWSLGLDISDVTLLMGAFLLLKEASALGLQSATTIIDTLGLSHEINLSDLTYLMLSYGQHRSQLSQQDSLIRTQIKTSTTIEELEGINYGSA